MVFSVEFAEHRLYNTGESTKYIDWKLYARTDKMFVKRFEEETNLRCRIVLDHSSSMYFPKLEKPSIEQLTKCCFRLRTAALEPFKKTKRCRWFEYFFRFGGVAHFRKNYHATPSVTDLLNLKSYGIER